MKQKTTMAFTIVAGAFAIFLIVLLILVDYAFGLKNSTKITLSVFLFLLGLIFASILLLSSYMIRIRREDVKKGFDHYIEKQIATTGVGVIIFNQETIIIWTSKAIEERFGKNLIGRKLMSISEEFESKYLKGEKYFKFTLQGVILETSVNIEERTVLLKDITAEETIIKNYNNEKNVIGELAIDNFQQFQVSLSEEELFKAQSHVIEMLDQLVDKYNIVYRQYVNGKYIIFTNQETLKKFVAKDFNFFNYIRGKKVAEGINLTASLGMSADSSDKKELTELAREGLSQAQARGGDQVTLMIPHQKPLYFGSKLEQKKTISRVKIKQIATRFEERLNDPKVKNVVIYGHKFADLDAVGAALGVAALADTYDKKWLISNVTFDSTTKATLINLNKETLEKMVKASKAQAMTNANTLVVIVDTPDISRTENSDILKKAKSNNFFIFDHHRPSETLDESINPNNVYIDTSSSSTSEIITEVISFMNRRIKINRNHAQMLLNGIYLDTKSFSKSVSSRTFAAASWLESKGAEAAVSTEILRIPESVSNVIGSITTQIEEIKPGYFMATYSGEVEQDVISMAADEILRTQNRKAAFVIAKIPGKNMYKMSARSIDTNVQKIAESVGGGGHFAAAAAVSSETLSIFADNIRQAIVSKKGDE